MLSTILVPKANFNRKEAIQWVSSHGYLTSKIESAPNYYRFRQLRPDPDARYYSKRLPNGILLVLHP
jgi:hypothetical protein